MGKNTDKRQGRAIGMTVARLGAVIGILAAIVVGLTQVRIETDLHSFLPADDDQVVAYDEVAEQFGADPVVVLLETTDGSDLLTTASIEAVLRLEGALAGIDGTHEVYGPATMLNQVAGRAQDLLSELFGRRDAQVQLAQAAARDDGATPAEVAAAGKEAQRLFDARYAPLIVQGLPGGAPTLQNAAFIRRVLLDDEGAPRSRWRFVVPAADTVALLVRPEQDLTAQQTADLVADVRSAVDESRLEGLDVSISGAPVLVSAVAEAALDDVPLLGAAALAASAIVLLFARWILWRRRLVPLAIAGVSIATTLAAFGLLGRPLSLGVIAFMPVILGVACYYPCYVAVGGRIRPVAVVAGATTISLATLGLSPLPLVHDLGIALGIGVAVSAGASLLVRPWLLRGAAPTAAPTTTAATMTRRSAPVTSRSSTRTDLARQLTGRRAAAVALSVAVLGAVLGWSQVSQLDVRADVTQFAGSLPVYEDAEHISDVLGSSGEVDVRLIGPDVLTPAAVDWSRRVVNSVVTAHGDRLRPVLSVPQLLEFLGQRATSDQIQSAMRLLPDYLTQAVVDEDREVAIASFAVDIEDVDGLGAAIDDIRETLPPPPEGYTVDVTGLPVVLLEGKADVTDDVVPSNLIALIASALVLALGLSRRTDAARALVSGTVATGVGFLALRVAGIDLNPVTAAMGALTAAVGCEFAVMFAEARRAGRPLLGKAVCVGAATSALGYGVLAFSNLSVIRELGLVLALAVVLALSSAWLVARVTVSAPEAPGSSDPSTPASGSARVPVASHA